MIKVVVIGSGNVAHHLIQAFAKSKKIDVTQVFSRQKKLLFPYSIRLKLRIISTI